MAHGIPATFEGSHDDIETHRDAGVVDDVAESSRRLDSSAEDVLGQRGIGEPLTQPIAMGRGFSGTATDEATTDATEEFFGLDDDDFASLDL